jgi:hypothetical protein
VSNWSSLSDKEKMVAGLCLLPGAGALYLADCVCVFINGDHRDVAFLKCGTLMGWFIVDPIVAAAGLFIVLYYGFKVTFSVRNDSS